jgi:hypothetical protein
MCLLPFGRTVKRKDCGAQAMPLPPGSMKPREVEKEPTELGHRILDACAELGLTQTSAERLWMGENRRGYLGRVIRGERGQSIEPAAAFRLADVLHVEARWLWIGEGPRHAVRAPTFAEAKEALRIGANLTRRGRPEHVAALEVEARGGETAVRGRPVRAK